MSFVIEKSVMFFALFLTFVFIISLFARLHWLPALLSHFYFQYFLGALILFPLVIICSQSYVTGLVLIFVSSGSFWMMQQHQAPPSLAPSMDPSQKLTVAVHNKHYKNRNYAQIYQSLKHYDIVLIVEVEKGDVSALFKHFKATHPFGSEPHTPRPDAMMIFSTYEVKDMSFPSLCPDICKTRAIRVKLSSPELTVYAFHTTVPVGARAYHIHSAQLDGASSLVEQDQSENIIAMGDWNTTAYAPAFKGFVSRSGLMHQNERLFPRSTWPSWGIFNMFKIQIDHILHSKNIRMVSVEKGITNGSDHHSLVAEFEMIP